MTVAASSSYVGFLESYARALVAADTPVGRLRRWAAELLQARAARGALRRPAPGRRSAGGFALRFPAVRTARDTARLAAEVFALPARIAAARKQRLAIALDEFQAIAVVRRRHASSTRCAPRCRISAQVGYVFAGSEPSLMERMLGPRRPFYKAGPVMRLEKIDPDDLRRLHRRAVRGQRHAARGRASATPSSISPPTCPYDVQRLAHETWDDVHEAGQRRRPGSTTCTSR